MIGIVYDNSPRFQGNTWAAQSYLYDAYGQRVGHFTKPIDHWGLNFGFGGFGGPGTAVQSLYKTSTLVGYGANHQYAGNALFDDCILEGAQRYEGSGNWVPLLKNCKLYGGRLYSYALPYIRFDRTTQKSGTGSDDIQFHGGSLTALRFLDLIDHSFTNEPPKTNWNGSMTNPTATFFLRRWSLTGKISDSAGNALANASIGLWNGSGQSESFTDTGLNSNTNFSNIATNFFVSNNANGILNAGDIIKMEAEIMSIANVSTTSVNVASRGLFSTNTNNWTRQNRPTYKMLDVISTDANGNFEPQYALAKRYQGQAFGNNNPYAYTTVDYGPHTLTIRKYGYKTFTTTSNITAPIVLSTRLATDPVIQASNTDQVSLYPIAFDHANSDIFVNGSANLNQIYDSAALTLTANTNMKYSDFFTSSDGINYTSLYDVYLSPGSTLSGTGKLTFSNNKTLIANGGSALIPWVDNSGTHVKISASNLLPNTRVLLRDTTSSIVLDNSLTSSNVYSFDYTWNGDKDYKLIATWVTGSNAMASIVKTGTITSAGVTINDTFVPNQIYNSNAIDGSLLTQFVPNFPNLDIDANDVDGTVLVQEIYAWAKFAETTANGILLMFNAVQADDAANYKIDVDIVDAHIFNLNTNPLLITGGRLYRSDGSTIIAQGSNSIWLDYGKAYLAKGSILKEEVEPGYTVQKVLQVTGSVLAGRVTGAGSGVETFSNISNTGIAIISTVDDQGNRANVQIL